MRNKEKVETVLSGTGRTTTCPSVKKYSNSSDGHF
jgi:hypothetical protein